MSGARQDDGLPESHHSRSEFDRALIRQPGEDEEGEEGDGRHGLIQQTHRRAPMQSCSVLLNLAQSSGGQRWIRLARQQGTAAREVDMPPAADDVAQAMSPDDADGGIRDRRRIFSASPKSPHSRVQRLTAS